ncbi:phosphodiester glycosidase family protein [Cerasicoccus frondis]|uniref:phosphodiester glycosidase family protein n=1 Tax=Cerasicoccus frondis TaxID=490090 RepID=UPI0028525DB6|nr:phosphodiester glycosidase family protein [Cerasicoccus frondis]
MSLLVGSDSPPLALELKERPTQDNEEPLVYWQEKTKSGLGEFTTVRLDLHSDLYALNLFINPPGPRAPDSANSRLELPITIAQVGKFLVGVNATSYTLPDKTPAATESWKTFIPGTNVTLRGFAKARDHEPIGDGPAAPSYPTLWQRKNGEIGLTTGPYPTDASWAFSAFHWLIKDGQPYRAILPYIERTSRTSAGISKDGRWFYLAVCGPSGDDSTEKQGASLPEMANHLISLNVDRALNFDGGSSTAMVIKKQDAYSLTPPPEKIISRPIPFMFGITGSTDG